MLTKWFMLLDDVFRKCKRRLKLIKSKKIATSFLDSK